MGSIPEGPTLRAGAVTSQEITFSKNHSTLLYSRWYALKPEDYCQRKTGAVYDCEPVVGEHFMGEISLTVPENVKWDYRGINSTASHGRECQARPPWLSYCFNPCGGQLSPNVCKLTYNDCCSWETYSSELSLGVTPIFILLDERCCRLSLYQLLSSLIWVFGAGQEGVYMNFSLLKTASTENKTNERKVCVLGN